MGTVSNDEDAVFAPKWATGTESNDEEAVFAPKWVTGTVPNDEEAVFAPKWVTGTESNDEGAVFAPKWVKGTASNDEEAVFAPKLGNPPTQPESSITDGASNLSARKLYQSSEGETGFVNKRKQSSGVGNEFAELELRSAPNSGPLSARGVIPTHVTTQHLIRTT